ncbi:site-specific integrase [bacterium]|nr:site-specific integrase [bacterium]
MASLSKNNGGWRIRYLKQDGKRVSIYPGKMPKKNAQQITVHIEMLISCRQSLQAIPPATAIWLQGSDQRLREKLYKAGLIEKPQELAKVVTLGSLVEGFISSRTDVKSGTKLIWKRGKDALIRCFDELDDITRFTSTDARSFRQFLLNEGKAEATVRKMSAIAAQFFEDAVDREEITRNPFKAKGVPRSSHSNRERFVFIDRELASKVLKCLPTNEWRLIFALSRFGGLRCPSEVKALEWSHVLWNQSRLIVPSPKTEHHDGKDERVIPIFPEIRPYLEAAYQENQTGSIIVDHQSHTNLSVKLKKILKRHKIKPWSKTFQNLRSTRETELAEEYPIQVVCSWIGNSPKVAMRHYLQVTDHHFDKASESDNGSVQKATASGCREK